MRLLLAVALVMPFIAYFRVGGKIPLPQPAHNHSVEVAEPGLFPMNVSAPNSTRFATTGFLERTVKLFQGEVNGAETVVVAPDDTLILIDASGKVYHVLDTELSPTRQCSSLKLLPEPLLQLPAGHPLGAGFVRSPDSRPEPPSWDLYICDALLGLLRVQGLLSGDPEKVKVQLVTARTSTQHNTEKWAGKHIFFADDLDSSSDGTVFFSYATNINPALRADGHWDVMVPSYLHFAQGVASGALLSHNASHGTVVLADHLNFANGVAVAHDESFVAVCETFGAAVKRYWLKGPLAGTTDTLIDQLPGMPDGISKSSDGNFWVAIFGPPPSIHKVSANRLVRALVAWMPASLRPKVPKIGMVIKVSPAGQVVQVLDDLTGERANVVTSATEHHGRLLLGSVSQPFVSCVEI